MKIQELIQADKGIPFYQVRVGEYFQFLLPFYDRFGSYPFIYAASQVLKKTDQVGAIDYPYDNISEENTLYINEKLIVKVIKKTSKAYKEYSKESESLLSYWDQTQLVIKR